MKYKALFTLVKSKCESEKSAIDLQASFNNFHNSQGMEIT